MPPTKEQQTYKQQPLHIIFGAGLTGGFLAGGLDAADQNVALVARPAKRKEMENGVLITDYDQNQHSLKQPVFIESGASNAVTADYLWLTVKCAAVNTSLKEISKLIDANTVIICCQNGFGSDQQVLFSFPRNKILRAIVGYNVVQPKAGHLHRSTEGMLVVESGDEQLTQLVSKLDTALSPSRVAGNFEAEKWAKLQLNLANAINALADIPTKNMLEQRDYRAVIAETMREMLNVTDRLQLRLPQLTPLSARGIVRLLDTPNWLFKLLGSKMLAIDPMARSSMWWDLSAGKQSEISYLNGALLDKAQELGISCPVNAAIVELVHAVERGDEKLGFEAATFKQRVLGKSR